MSALQIHDMLQRQIVAEGGYGEGYGLHGGYSDMGESEGGARRRAKKAFPKSAKAGLCEYRLFQAQHKGLSRAELSAKWAHHKAKGGSASGGAMMGGCGSCGGAGLAGGCAECGGVCGGAYDREFGPGVDGRCVYREFKRDHPGMTQTALSEGWRGAKFANELHHIPAPEGAGGFLGERKAFQKIRAKHKKASRAELHELYEKARHAYHKRATGRRGPHLKMRDLGGKTIHELIEKCAAKVAKGEAPTQSAITKISKHPYFTKELYDDLMARLEAAAARQLSQRDVAVVAEAASEVAATCGEEIKQQQKTTAKGAKSGSGMYGGADPTVCELAKQHAAEVLMEHPAAQSNPEAAAEVIRAANMSSPMMECGALDTFAGQACQERNRRLARAQGMHAEEESGAGLAGGAKRMTAAQKKAFLRKCMRKK